MESQNIKRKYNDLDNDQENPVNKKKNLNKDDKDEIIILEDDDATCTKSFVAESLASIRRAKYLNDQLVNEPKNDTRIQSNTIYFTKINQVPNESLINGSNCLSLEGDL
jgi:hypothetical protein